MIYLSGTVECGVNSLEFMEKFLDFVENNNWFFAGVAKEVTEKGGDECWKTVV